GRRPAGRHRPAGRGARRLRRLRRDLPRADVRRPGPLDPRVHRSGLRAQRVFQGLRDDRLAARLPHRAARPCPPAPDAVRQLLHLHQRVRAVGGGGRAAGGDGGQPSLPAPLRRAAPGDGRRAARRGAPGGVRADRGLLRPGQRPALYSGLDRVRHRPARGGARGRHAGCGLRRQRRGVPAVLLRGVPRAHPGRATPPGPLPGPPRLTPAGRASMRSERGLEWTAVGLAYAAVALVIAGWLAIDRRPPEWDHANHLERAVLCARDLARGDLQSVVLRSTFYPPLVPCLAGLAFRLLGSDVAAGQGVEVAFLGLGMAATYLLARRGGNGLGGVVAALVFGTSPIVVWQALRFQLDLPLAALVAVALEVLARTESFGRRGWSISAGA